MEEKIQKSLKRKRDAASLFGYSNESNPFNDPKLSSRFTEWDNGNTDQTDHLEELHSLKSRRIQRQLEQKHLIESRLARERQELARLWGDTDDHFEWKQLLLKSEIRIKENRATILDHIFDYSKLLLKDDLLKNGANLSSILLNNSNESTHSNISINNDLNTNEDQMKATRINDFLRGISMKILSNSPPEIPKFSSQQTSTLENLLNEINNCLTIEYLPFKELWESIKEVISFYLKQKSNSQHNTLDPAIQEQIEELFDGKTYSELIETENEIKEQLSDPDADIEYWQSLLQQMNFYKSKSLITHYFEYMLKFWNLYENNKEKSNVQQNSELKSNLTEQEKTIRQSDEGYTTALTKEFELEELTQEEKKIRFTKPQYYNRVILGFEWSKYNRVHFDTDNPPPKQIQGYRFNLFYPLLEENSPSPSYSIEKYKKGFSIVRFHTGPPYADIAFQIVDKGDWETRPSKGYRCEFHQGILSLWFKFKRHTRKKNQ